MHKQNPVEFLSVRRQAEAMSCSILKPIFSGKFLYYFVSWIIELVVVVDAAAAAAVAVSSTLRTLGYWCVVTHLNSRPLFVRSLPPPRVEIYECGIRLTWCASNRFGPWHGKTSNRNVILQPLKDTAVFIPAPTKLNDATFRCWRSVSDGGEFKFNITPHAEETSTTLLTNSISIFKKKIACNIFNK